MPTYVYECSSCEKVFEIEQRIVEDALSDCECGSMGSLKRIIQPTAIMFKGSGFYINDSQKATNPAAAPVEKPVSTEATPVVTPSAPASAPSSE
jgi:putative FmdB family regulatory protein